MSESRAGSWLIRYKHWLFFAFFASLFGLLLLLRTGVWNKKPTQVPASALSSPGEFRGGNTWMNIIQDDRKIGFSHTRYTQTATGYQFTETVLMKINTMGLIQDVGLTTRGRLNPDFSVAAFSFEVSSGRFSFSADGSISDRMLSLTIDNGTDKQTTEIKLSDKIYFPSGILQAAAFEDLTPGRRLSVKVFDPLSMGQEPIQLTVFEKETIRIMGEARSATKVSLKYKGATQLAWIDDQGGILKEQGMLGLTLEKTTQKDALYEFPDQPGRDLTRIASIPSNVAIADSKALSSLRVELSGVQAQTLSLNGGRQSYQAPVLTIVKEQIPPATHRRQIDDPNIIRFLQPGPLVQSDHPRIQKLANEITEEADNDLEKIRLLMGWIKDHIQKRPVLSIPNALAILENRMGDCNEHAVLFAALARASGIPTRIEAGVVYLKHRFYYHAWNAVYLDGWVTLDALFYQFPADVTHIRLADGDPKDQLDILGLIGNLSIHIRDDKHSDDSAQ